MSQYYTLATTAYPISQHRDFEAWQNHIEIWIKQAAEQKARLVLFPEYGSMELLSLFSSAIQADLQEQLEALQDLVLPFQQTWIDLSKKYEIIIVAPSYPFKLGLNWVNRTWVFSPRLGLVGHQDKWFMTRFEDEDWGIKSNRAQLSLFRDAQLCFGIQVCYDVEFALGSQRLCQAGARLILAPSCTEAEAGASRVHLACRARSLENQAYTLVAQTVGEALWSPAVDKNYGYMAAYAPPDLGFPTDGILFQTSPQVSGLWLHRLDLRALDEVRVRGQVLNFRDHAALAYGFLDGFDPPIVVYEV